MSTTPVVAPGRLGDPDTSPATDPRINPKQLEALRELNVDQNIVADLPEFSIENLTPFIANSHNVFETIYNEMDNELPSDQIEIGIETTTTSFRHAEGHDVKLHIYKPANASAPLPAVLYIHGGGMVFLSTTNKVHRRWVRSIAAEGIIAISVDFRNAYTEKKHNPFPAGLNDCAAAVRYIASHRAELGISKLVVQGESGGGNLSIATALKANREGWINEIDGVHASAPYLSGEAHTWPEERKARELPSLIENNGYLFDNHALAAFAYYYGPEDLKNPHAWPYQATVQDLAGLPAFVLLMNELDPLRDEGIAFYRKLMAAGVKVEAKVTLGVIHGAELLYRKAIPEVNAAGIRDVVGFAKSL
ncbi:hypothetical protein Q7P37_010381 [Cladosporium fusiforme]